MTSFPSERRRVICSFNYRKPTRATIASSWTKTTTWTISNSCPATSSAVFRPVSTQTSSRKRVKRRLETKQRSILSSLKVRPHRMIHLTRVSCTGTPSSQVSIRRNRVLSQFWPSLCLSQTFILTIRVPAGSRSSRKSNIWAIIWLRLLLLKQRGVSGKLLPNMHARSKDLTRGTLGSTKLLSKQKRRRRRKKSLWRWSSKAV